MQNNRTLRECRRGTRGTHLWGRVAGKTQHFSRWKGLVNPVCGEAKRLKRQLCATH